MRTETRFPSTEPARGGRVRLSWSRPCAHLIAVAAWLALYSCHARPVAAESLLSMDVSAAHRRDLLPLGRERYAEPELDAVFLDLRAQGDPFCRMVWGQAKWDLTRAQKFLSPGGVKAVRQSCTKCLPSIKAGCWNFYSMNDLEPDRDFRLIRALFPGRRWDCYSVGFLQPYIMHGTLQCESLSMVDIDWRLMHGHTQMVRLYRERAFAESRSLHETVSRLDVGWVALAPTKESKHRVNVDFFCSRHKQQKFCPGYFRAAQGVFERLRRVRLSLTALHDEPYRAGAPGSTKVIYFSNALESAYTSPAEFRTLMGRLQSALEPNGSALLIHHVGGYRLFGLYELRRGESGTSLRTVCRDVYLMPDRARYDSHMERYSKTRKPPACWRLVARHGLEREMMERARLKRADPRR